MEMLVDVPRKVNNQGYEEIEIEPFEVQVREQIGAVLKPDFDVIEVSSLDKTPLNSSANNVFNIGESARVGSSYIRKLLET